MAKTTTKKLTASKKTTTTKKPAKAKYPEKYTLTSIIDYLSKMHELPKTKTKEIVESLFDVVNTGVMRGERVPIGKIGILYVRTKPRQKARKGRNPQSGEEITISAKPASKVPKFNFSRNFKEAVLKAKIQKAK